MVKLKNTGPPAVVYWTATPTEVKTNHTVEVEGEVVTDRRVKRLNEDAAKAAKAAERPAPPPFELPSDAILLERPSGELVAFSTEVWQLVDDKADDKSGS